MHTLDGWIFLLIVVATAVMLIFLHLTRAGRILHERIPDRPRRRMFLASVSFFVTFLFVRLLVAAITHHIGPFGWVMMGGRHIHHLVWGILLLLVVGYLLLAEFGTCATAGSIFVSRLISILFGMGAALTLDEFALWLNLDPNAYWTREGRASVDAVILFGALLAAGTWGAPLFTKRREAAEEKELK
ncbi:MAG TPA: hypothetical protein VK819_12705 [Acidobacteriaceae bacterium]|jgi:hypothetical protein|nr:hypothetical protein [Acidobacteriaceae bacterium]